MRILVVGNGAREDALSWRLAQSPSCEAIFAAPGNAGTASRGANWEISATDGKGLADRALREGIDLVVLGPETAIAAGVGDRLREAGIAVFGPNRSAGRLESSKIYAKRFMERHGIPTAKALVVHSLDGARNALAQWRGGVVVKADGLAAGKGVIVTPGAEAARAVVTDWYASSKVPGGGLDVLLEEPIAGREVSVFAICDGRAIVPFAAACDYKRAGDGDTGPNTGGMGAYSPPAGLPDDLDARVRERILAPLVARTSCRRRRVRRGFVLRADVERRRTPCHRVQRAFWRSGDASTDAAHRRRFSAALALGGAGCDGSFAGDGLGPMLRRSSSRDQRLPAKQYAAAGFEFRCHARGRLPGILGSLDAGRRNRQQRRWSRAYRYRRWPTGSTKQGRARTQA